MAAAFFSLGKVQESLEILADLEVSLGDDENFLSLYGAALRRSGDLRLSSIIFRRALDQSPHNPNLNNNYAKAKEDFLFVLKNGGINFKLRSLLKTIWIIFK